MRFATLHLAWRLTFAISLLLVTVGSLLPTQQLPDLAFDIWDKAQHAAGFGWLMFCGLMSHGWRDGGWRLAVALGAWGAVIELLQAWSGWRHGDLGDLAADLLGIAVVLLIWRSVRPAASQPRS
ncbi:MAG: VanZ family protein [Hydrogenophaga sp.]|nr:VanZ family protein [Comamonadaceae bacterium]MBS4038769.1 VanZ family protein [Hydrogenophaga sp.]